MSEFKDVAKQWPRDEQTSNQVLATSNRDNRTCLTKREQTEVTYASQPEFTLFMENASLNSGASMCWFLSLLKVVCLSNSDFIL